ncbi:hypothetical protein J6590_016320 [Homalodisca vitripennis]|nr:hypothetical protein J6590_016320 [Homalodisca vitripennis]
MTTVHQPLCGARHGTAVTGTGSVLGVGRCWVHPGPSIGNLEIRDTVSDDDSTSTFLRREARHGDHGDRKVCWVSGDVGYTQGLAQYINICVARGTARRSRGRESVLGARRCWVHPGPSTVHQHLCGARHGTSVTGTGKCAGDTVSDDDSTSTSVRREARHGGHGDGKVCWVSGDVGYTQGLAQARHGSHGDGNVCWVSGDVGYTQGLAQYITLCAAQGTARRSRGRESVLGVGRCWVYPGPSTGNLEIRNVQPTIKAQIVRREARYGGHKDGSVLGATRCWVHPGPSTGNLKIRTSPSVRREARHGSHKDGSVLGATRCWVHPGPSTGNLKIRTSPSVPREARHGSHGDGNVCWVSGDVGYTRGLAQYINICAARGTARRSRGRVSVLGVGRCWVNPGPSTGNLKIRTSTSVRREARHGGHGDGKVCWVSGEYINLFAARGTARRSRGQESVLGVGRCWVHPGPSTGNLNYDSTSTSVRREARHGVHGDGKLCWVPGDAGYTRGLAQYINICVARGTARRSRGRESVLGARRCWVQPGPSIGNLEIRTSTSVWREARHVGHGDGKVCWVPGDAGYTRGLAQYINICVARGTARRSRGQESVLGVGRCWVHPGPSTGNLNYDSTSTSVRREARHGVHGDGKVCWVPGDAGYNPGLVQYINICVARGTARRSRGRESVLGARRCWVQPGPSIGNLEIRTSTSVWREARHVGQGRESWVSGDAGYTRGLATGNLEIRTSTSVCEARHVGHGDGKVCWVPGDAGYTRGLAQYINICVARGTARRSRGQESVLGVGRCWVHPGPSTGNLNYDSTSTSVRREARHGVHGDGKVCWVPGDAGYTRGLAQYINLFAARGTARRSRGQESVLGVGRCWVHPGPSTGNLNYDSTSTSVRREARHGVHGDGKLCWVPGDAGYTRGLAQYINICVARGTARRSRGRESVLGARRCWVHPGPSTCNLEIRRVMTTVHQHLCGARHGTSVTGTGKSAGCQEMLGTPGA